jgi:hypothetical protein
LECLEEIALTVGGVEVKQSLEDVLISVWRQTMVEQAALVKLDAETYSVKSTPRRGLKHVDFRFDGMNLRGLEQNPETRSRWAAMAREGKKVMQFLEGGRYVAVVVNGKVHLYKKSALRD